MVTGLHHLSIIVSAEDSVEFYKSTFGFKEVKRIERSYDTVVVLEGMGVQLQLFVEDRHEPRSTPEPLGLRSLSFTVDEIEGVAAKLGLKESDIEFDWFGLRYMVITDPDGNQIQLHE